MAAYASKYHIGIDGKGYVLSQTRSGTRLYQKKKAPAFVNKFGGGDSSYRDATFWQYFVQTNWRNGSKQLKFDDPGKFWKSSDVDTTILEQLTLSKAFVSAGQIASNVNVNCMEAWRSSASWWDSNYGYRQQLVITAGSGSTVPSGYPVKISIDTAALQTATKVRSDRKDWRVVYFNGSSWVDLTRDYVDTTVTFFALQSAITASSSDSNYYVYYGYASESTTKQASTEAEYNSVYGMYGTTPDANSIAIYHFREGSGNPNDDSSNSITATANGSPTWETTGKLGRDVLLGGDGDGYIIDDAAAVDLGSLTLELWVKIAAATGESFIIAKYAAYELKEVSGKFRATLRFDGSSLDLTTALAYDDGNWHHVALTYDGVNTAKIYVDGTAVATSTSGEAVVSNDRKVFIGANSADGSSASASGFNGRIQHVRISNTARSSFPYVLTSEPSVVAGSETTTQPPSSSFDLYAGGSDGKVYKYDGTTTWTEQFDATRIIWYETGNDANEIVGDEGGTEKAKSQGFQLPASLTVSSASFYLKKNAGTPGNITVRIETDSTNKPSGTLANASATGTITSFSTTSYGWVTVTFAAPFSLSSATTYHLVLKTAAAANDTNYAWAADASSPSFSSGAQSYSTDGGSTWTADSTKDQYFRLHSQSTEILSMLVSSLSSQKLHVGVGNPTGQTNGDARIYSFDGTTWALEKAFATATESMVTAIAEYSSANKAYVGLGPQAKVYETTDFSTFTLSKDINIPQNPGYIYAMKEYNRVLHAAGGSPEFLPAQYYNGFINTYDTTAWNALYPFDFTVIRSLEFYDAYLFMGTYHGHLYVYDTSTLNPLFNFKDQYGYRVEIKTMKYFDDKLYIGLYPQAGSNETNVGIWIFDRRGLSLAHTVSGVTGYRCFAVVNGTLFVGTGTNGYVYKLDPTKYATSGWEQSSYFDANLPSIDKLYNAVTIRHDPLESGQNITVYYKFKESDSWTLLGLSNTVGDTEKILSFPTGTYSKKISLKTELNTTDTTSTPVLTERIMQYSLYPTRKWQWTLRVKATKHLRLLDNSLEPRTSEQIRADLEDLFSSQQLYRFTDVDGVSYNVLMNDLDTQSWVINQNDVNEEEVAITLLEA